MKKAIRTKYHGPTNTRGSRVTATDGDRNWITIEWDHSLTSDQNHRAAAVALCKKLGWTGTLAQGGFPDSCVFVFVNSDETFRVDGGAR